MRSRVRLAGPLAVAAVLVVAGCSAEHDVTPPPRGGSPLGNTQPEVEPEPQTEAKQDVRVTSCTQDSFTPRVAVEVTNSTATAHRYAVSITIKNRAGKSTDAYFVRGRMRAGQTVTETVPGASHVPGKITCQISKAKRLPPR